MNGVEMFDKSKFIHKMVDLQSSMQSSLRGDLDSRIEMRVIDDLCDIYRTMVDKYESMVHSGSTFPAQAGVGDSPESDRVYNAMFDFLERMELDFARKFALDLQHGLDKEVAIGKIKISLLDGVRRNLNSARPV